MLSVFGRVTPQHHSPYSTFLKSKTISATLTGFKFSETETLLQCFTFMAFCWELVIGSYLGFVFLLFGISHSFQSIHIKLANG